MPWLQLIRWKNLLIIFFTQLLAWCCIFLFEEPSVLFPAQFFLLTLSTVLIAAAGNIINDYFDLKIDLQNRPAKVVLDTKIPRKQAIVAHTVLNIVALCLAALVAIPARHPEWLLLQLGCTFLLWFYSTNFKRQYIIGNVTVALLAALTIIVLMVYEPVLYEYMHFPPVTKINGNHRTSLPLWILGAYAYFAFMLTWMREIVKDIEDIKGDEAEGCKTMPIIKGIEFSRYFTVVLALLAIIPLGVASYVLYTHLLSVLALYLLGVTFAIAAWMVFLFKGHTEKHYHAASNYLKGIMLLGVCSFFIYYLQLFLNNAT